MSDQPIADQDDGSVGDPPVPQAANQGPAWGAVRPTRNAPRQPPLGAGGRGQPQGQGVPQQQGQQPAQVVQPVAPIMDVATIPADVAQWTAEMLRVLGWNSKRVAQGDMNTKNAALLQAQANNASPLLNDLNQKHAELARAYAANGVWSSAQEMQASEIRATLAFEAMPGKKPELKTGSANPTFWLKGVPDPITHIDSEFIFKPVTQGSLMAGIPEGGEPVREALTGRAAEQLSAFTGLDFKMPLTNVISVDSARLSDYRPDDEFKRLPNTPTQVGSLQQFSPSQGELRSHLLGSRQNVTAQSCQAIAILDTVTLNLDRHDGNLLLDQAGTGIIPIDHGLSFPGASAVTTGNLGRNMAGDKNVMLRLPNSYEPFDQASLDGIDNIDPDLMQAALSAESKKMGDLHPSLEGKMSAEALSISNLAAQFLKAAAPRLPPAVLQAALGANAAALLDTKATPQARAQATAQVIAEYEPKVAAIKEFWMLPGDTREALYEKLDADGLLSNMSDDRERWLYQNIDVVLDYNRGSNPMPPPLKARPAVGADEAKEQIREAFPKLKLPPAEKDWLPAWNDILKIGNFGALKSTLVADESLTPKTLREVKTWFATYMAAAEERENDVRANAIQTAFPGLTVPRQGGERADMIKAWVAIARLGGMKAVRAKVQGMPPKPAPRDPAAALLLLLSEPPTWAAQALKGLDYLDQLVALDPNVVSGPNQAAITQLRTRLANRRPPDGGVGVVKQLTDRVVAAAVAIIGPRYKALEYRVSVKEWEVAQNVLNTAYSGQVKIPLEYLLDLERRAPPNPIRT